jgi:hypothetical protein
MNATVYIHVVHNRCEPALQQGGRKGLEGTKAQATVLVKGTL